MGNYDSNLSFSSGEELHRQIKKITCKIIREFIKKVKEVSSERGVHKHVAHYVMI